MIPLPENYKTQDPVAIDMVQRLYSRYANTGNVMPASQRVIYEQVRDYLVERVKQYRGYPKQIHKPTVADVGCGLGIGTNILSQEAQFTWGIDNDENHVSFARQMFARDMNNIYFTPQVTFDVIDVLNEPRGLMQFDVIVCVEVIEHIPRTETDSLVRFCNRLFKTDKYGKYLSGNEGTVLFLSSPNRNSPDLDNTCPRNPHHCFEASAGELYEYLIGKYRHVTVCNERLEPQDLDTTDTPLVFKLEVPLQHGES